MINLIFFPKHLTYNNYYTVIASICIISTSHVTKYLSTDKPLCHKMEIKLIGAALQEPTSVECEVDAFPPPDTFEWTLNNSAGSIKVDPVSKGFKSLERNYAFLNDIYNIVMNEMYL